MARRLVVFLFAILLVGCENAADTTTPPTEEVSDTASAELEQLRAEIRRLESELQRLEMDQVESNSTLDQEQLRQIRSIHEKHWDEVTVFNAEDSVTIRDTDFLESLRSWMTIGDQVSLGGGGTPYTMESFHIQFKNNSETVLIHAVSKGAVEFPDILPGVYYRANMELTNLGKALLPKPAFLPEESFGSKMLDSGFLLVRWDGWQYYDLSESRVRVMAAAFLRADKKETAKPERMEDEALAEVSFFHYGEKIVMGIYPAWIRIQDGAEEVWYEVDPFVAEQIDLSLRAD